MLVRVVVVLLLVLNIGALAWIASTYRDTPETVPIANADSVPTLVLLSERETFVAPPALPPVTEAPKADDACVSIGPFTNRSTVRTAMAALTPLTRRVQFREDQLERSRGWWVFLPAFADRDAALAAARELSNRGVKDYYVISAGDQQDTVSLGLFRDKRNAETRQRELIALGVQAQIEERKELTPGFWIDFAQPADAAVDWQTLTGADSSIAERKIDCF